jgi:hypothetical protein
MFITIEGTGGGPVEFDCVRLDPGYEVMCLEPKTAVRPSDGARGTVLNLPPGSSTSPVTVLRVVGMATCDA